VYNKKKQASILNVPSRCEFSVKHKELFAEVKYVTTQYRLVVLNLNFGANVTCIIRKWENLMSFQEASGAK
jgi:hypothetical protein